MIKFENIETYGWETTIRGMRNPMNSWEKSDSFCNLSKLCRTWPYSQKCASYFSERGDGRTYRSTRGYFHYIGPNDYSLMLKLAKAGADHAKFRRMIIVTMDILAPLYWWKEFDTYKVGTVANSCSTMHKITEKEFTLDDFSHEHIIEYGQSIPSRGCYISAYAGDTYYDPNEILEFIVEMLNKARELYLKTKDKKYWWQIIQLLPSSYNQLRTVQLNYEVLANIYKSRRGHKLDEWREFCAMIERLPYSKIITLEEEN